MVNKLLEPAHSSNEDVNEIFRGSKYLTRDLIDGSVRTTINFPFLFPPSENGMQDRGRRRGMQANASGFYENSSPRKRRNRSHLAGQFRVAITRKETFDHSLLLPRMRNKLSPRRLRYVVYISTGS